jgi:beta-glucosidase
MRMLSSCVCARLRWGRIQETVGEDPLLASDYAIGLVRGMQGGASPQTRPNTSQTRFNTSQGASEPRFAAEEEYQMVSMAKHFVDYTVEGCTGPDPVCRARGPSTDYPDRHSINVNVSAHDQMDFFLQPWRAAVQGGGLGGMMCR